MKCIIHIFVWVSLIVTCLAENKASVGVNIAIDGVEISGGKVEVIPRVDSEVPIVLRVVEISKTDDGYRYDFRVEGYEVGQYDLCDYLQTTNGGKVERDEPISFEVYSVLDHDGIELRELGTSEPEQVGGYKKLLWVLGVVWAVGLVALLIFLRKKKEVAAEEVKPLTFAEKMQPLLEKASAGNASIEERADLEKMVIQFWVKQSPELKEMPAAEVLTELRNRSESAPLLLALERWLHSLRPVSKEDLQSVLEPYKGKEID